MSETDLVKFVKSLDDEEFEDLCESIKKSIKHWEDIRDGNDVEISNLSCSLCQTYISCVRCPIGIYTDEDGCKNTPFMEWHYHFDNAHPLYEGDHRVICEECQELAQKEVDFLKDLLSLWEEFSRQVQKGKTYSVGSRFRIKGNEYILGRVDSQKVIFINTITGNRWVSAFTVNDASCITEKEIENVRLNSCTKEKIIPIK